MAKQDSNDLTRSGRVRTKVETKTVVEDRTNEAVEMPRIEYQAEQRELAHGTVETRYGEPVGGFPQADSE